MDDFFDKVEAYIAAAKAKAQDLAEKGADALEALAAWVRDQSGPAPVVGASDPHRLAACLSECQALAAPAKGAKGAAAQAAVGGPFAGLLAKLLAAILAALK